jgi:hypothetical protein
MKTPDNCAGIITEKIMARIKSRWPEIGTNKYNLIYECALAELHCVDQLRKQLVDTIVERDKLKQTPRTMPMPKSGNPWNGCGEIDN